MTSLQRKVMQTVSLANLSNPTFLTKRRMPDLWQMHDTNEWLLYLMHEKNECLLYLERLLRTLAVVLEKLPQLQIWCGSRTPKKRKRRRTNRLNTSSKIDARNMTLPIVWYTMVPTLMLNLCQMRTCVSQRLELHESQRYTKRGYLCFLT